MTSHKIPKETYNSDLSYCINEFVRNVEHRKMLRDWWFHGETLEGLAGKYHISLTSVKQIIYEEGDPIILKATQKSNKRK